MWFPVRDRNAGTARGSSSPEQHGLSFDCSVAARSISIPCCGRSGNYRHIA
jgi:hypothetical protein